MRMMYKLALAATVALPHMGAPAMAWRASSGLEVFALSDGTVEVLSRAGSATTDFWCAIGDYAVRQARVPTKDRVYLVAPMGPSATRSNYKSVRFGFTKPANADTGQSYSLSIKRVGENLSVGMARQYCFGNYRRDRFF
ncbi:hypothetical protein K3727_13180 [Rhodobacteraceae bacterium M382]|nr:hypothetical protein K3727_13180 [Rhodobacteraceae bacterium M382]